MNWDGEASAPATTANLGPLFDSMALALSPRCHVRARRSDAWEVTHLGAEALPTGERDGVLIAAQRAVGEIPLQLEVKSEIPVARGLGSSAAAFVAGAAAALRAVEGDSTHDHVFRIASELEGHDDQPAAAVYGGLVLIPAEGMPIRLAMHPSLVPVVAVPDVRQATSEARDILPSSYPADVTIRSVARAAALTAGLITGDPVLLAAAHGDEIHEKPRSALGPEVDDLIEIARRAGAVHAARSGAGSSVLALTDAENAGRLATAFEEWGASVIADPPSFTGLT